MVGGNAELLVMPATQPVAAPPRLYGACCVPILRRRSERMRLRAEMHDRYICKHRLQGLSADICRATGSQCHLPSRLDRSH
jgi:hypothetical protein